MLLSASSEGVGSGPRRGASGQRCWMISDPCICFDFLGLSGFSVLILCEI